MVANVTDERLRAQQVSAPISPSSLSCAPQLAQGHRASRPRGTGSVGDSVGEGLATDVLIKAGGVSS
jgi:hypothetical protein